MTDSNVDLLTKPKPVHPLFNDPLGDVTFQSSDRILFHVQRKYLEATTGGFPGAEFDTNGEVTHLTESAAVLAVLFGFIYPKQYPDIEELEFPLLAEVAEAAEKYEAFAAMELCRLQMRHFLPEHSLAILAHATRHDCSKLIQQTISHLARHSLTKIAGMLPTRYILPWIHYQMAHEAAFSSALTSLLALKVASPAEGSRPGQYFTSSMQPQTCHSCLVVMIAALEEMKAMESMEELQKAFEKKRTPQKACQSTACQYPVAFEKICSETKEKIKEIKFQA